MKDLNLASSITLLKRILFCLVFSFSMMSTYTLSAEQAKWVQFTEDKAKGFKFYLNTSEIIPKTKGVYRIWEDDIPEPKRYKVGNTDASLVKIRWLKEVNCNNKSITYSVCKNYKK